MSKGHMTLLALVFRIWFQLLKGGTAPQPKSFVHYLKIINTFFFFEKYPEVIDQNNILYALINTQKLLKQISEKKKKKGKKSLPTYPKFFSMLHQYEIFSF